MGKIIVVTGGARSGKSSFAESLCLKKPTVGYIATSRIQDNEMADRIQKHRKRRPSSWKTFEVYTDLANRLPAILEEADLFLLDCVTIYIANKMFEGGLDYTSCSMDEVASIEEKIQKEFLQVLDTVKQRKTDMILVTNEIGMGIVPENRLARIYRDIVGRINQLCASVADDVFLVVSGIPIQIKRDADALF